MTKKKGKKKMESNYTFDGENIDDDELPKPTGWRVLVGKVRIKKSGSIILPDETQQYLENGLSIVKVLAMGPLCFDDDKYRGANPKRPIEGWYKVGDIIVIGKFVGQVMKCTDKNGETNTLKFINDDEVVATISSLKNIVI